MVVREECAVFYRSLAEDETKPCAASQSPLWCATSGLVSFSIHAPMVVNTLCSNDSFELHSTQGTPTSRGTLGYGVIPFQGRSLLRS